MDLFDHSLQEQLSAEAPLAARMRPTTLDEIVGQEHIFGPGTLLRRAIEADRLFSSIIFYGPPGTGKTTIARVIATQTKAEFVSLSAVLAGIPDLREIIKDAIERRRLYRRRTILFIDEVHRWNKAQQDALLPHVENGLLTLIGATTQNPYFDVIQALVSRSRIFELKPLSEENILTLLQRALEDPERGYGKRNVLIDADALQHLAFMAGGDARSALNALELAVETTPPQDGQIHITLEIAAESIQKRVLRYDKNEDAHYDTISAFIKSVRGSDPDAALYWLAKMLTAGEDPRFILRRLIILAGEDIGLADPQGLVVANAAAQAFEYIGMPEGFTLSSKRRFTLPPHLSLTLLVPILLRKKKSKPKALEPCHCTSWTPAGTPRALGMAPAMTIRTATRSIGRRSNTCPMTWSAPSFITPVSRVMKLKWQSACGVGARLKPKR
jgi:putative ATPase